MFGVRSPKIIYGFAAGRVKVLETRMVSRARIDRLIEAETLDEIHRVLAETDYGPELRAADTIEEVEAALDQRLGQAYLLLRESNVPAAMARYFQCRHDFVNLRILLKSGFGRQVGVPLSSMGEVSPDKVEALVKQGSFAGLPDHLRAAAPEAVARYGESRRFDTIDAIIDRHYFATLLRLATRLRSRWIFQYTKLLIDLANGRAVLRSARRQTGAAEPVYHLIPGGDIDIDTWTALAFEADTTGRFIEMLPSGTLREPVAQWLISGAAVGDYDLMADAVLIEFLVTAHRFTVGPEPVFAYVAAREHEGKLLRMIIFGHLSGLPPAKLKGRVSRVYE